MGFIDTVKGQYKKGRKMIEDYQEGAKKRDMEATERFKEKTKLLKEKTKVKREYAKAKADYAKAKGGGKSIFENNNNSMFGGGKGANMGLSNVKEPKKQNWGIGGGYSVGNSNGARANNYTVGGSMRSDKKKKRRY